MYNFRGPSIVRVFPGYFLGSRTTPQVTFNTYMDTQNVHSRIYAPLYPHATITTTHRKITALPELYLEVSNFSHIYHFFNILKGFL